MSSPDPFSARFDSIEIDPARAPSAAALDGALAACGTDQPGFYLVDDAGGRFVVDRDMGVISLKDAALLSRERGAVRTARLRVVEPSGSTYEQTMQLRITGIVPQMVGAEDFSFLADMTAEIAEAPPVAPVVTPRAEALTIARGWARYAAAQASHGKATLLRTRRFIAGELPPHTSVLTTADLSIHEELPELGAPGTWSL